MSAWSPIIDSHHYFQRYFTREEITRSNQINQIIYFISCTAIQDIRGEDYIALKRRPNLRLKINAKMAPSRILPIMQRRRSVHAHTYTPTLKILKIHSYIYMQWNKLNKYIYI